MLYFGELKSCRLCVSGDHEEALRLARDLEALDDDIDAVEREIILWKKGGKGKKEHVL